MDISMFGNFAEILAAIGVIGSLIFLAVQVRKNTQTLRSQILEMHFDRVAMNYSRPLDSAVANVVDKGKKSFRDLSSTEKIIFNAWASEYLLNTNHLVTFNKERLIEPWAAIMIERRCDWFFKNPGVRQWWQDDDRHPIPEVYEVVYNERIMQNWSNTG